jgi:putative transposase
MRLLVRLPTASGEATWRGVTIVVADRFYPSSQLCSSCGYRNRSLTPKGRRFCCPSCGVSLDRDHNAALNLRPVVGMPPKTLNARGGNVSPGPARQIPPRREPSSETAALAAA